MRTAYKTLFAVTLACALASGTAAVRAGAGTTLVADGLWMSSRGTLYITSPTDNSVKYWTGSKLATAVTDKDLRWPDTMSEGPDGTLYVTASHIQDSSWFKPGAPKALAH